MNNQVLVSIITPTYNRAEYLKRAIDSVLSQTYANFEYLIVDDNPQGSDARKETEAIINDYTDTRIRYIQNETNMGGANSRNVGIQMAKGQYIAFLDDDDMYLDDKTEVQIVQMLENDWDVCVMDGATYNYVTGEKLTERHQKVRSNMSREELMKAHLMYHISGTNSFMFKTDFIRKIGGFDDVPSCQEYILMQKAINASPRFGYIPEIHIKNFQHPGEQLSTGPKKLKGQMNMIEQKKKYFNLLTKKERGAVMCRHHGVLFFVHLKMHNYSSAIKEAFLCFVASPTDAWRWMLEYRGKIKA